MCCDAVAFQVCSAVATARLTPHISSALQHTTQAFTTTLTSLRMSVWRGLLRA